MDNGTILTITMWGLGICATGFFFLAMWIRQVADKVLISEIKEIKTALIGDIKKPGILTMVYRNSEDIKGMKVRCREIHPTIVE